MTDAVLPTTIITDLNRMDVYAGIGLRMWTVYDHPRDFPNHVVARLFDGMTARPTEYVFMADSEEAMREAMSVSFIWMERNPDDEPHILGVYL